MSAIDKYRASIDKHVGFAVGLNGASDQMGELLKKFEQSGDPGRATAYAFQSMKMAWSALPDDIRDMALQSLEEAVQKAVQRIGEGLGDTPVVGWVADIVLLLFETIGEVRKAFDANNTAWSKQDKNAAQIATFGKASSPTSWVFSTVKGVPYMKYGGGVGKNRWRRYPSIRPTVDENIVFGYDKYPAPKGNCSPGKPYRSTDDGWEAKDGTSTCTYYASFSALFYPFWSPNHGTEPIPYYGIEVWPKNAGFKDEGVDPNAVLMKRQALMLADPVTNFQVRGSFLKKRHDRFLSFVKYNSTGIDIDPFKVPAKDEQRYPDTKLFLDENGMIRTYYRSAVDGKISLDAVIASGGGANITAAMYNCVVGMTRAFFTARSAFLENSTFLEAYVKDGRVNSFDPDVKAAVKDAAKPARLKKKPARLKKDLILDTVVARPARESGSGGAALALVAVPAGALLWIKRGVFTRKKEK